MLGRLLGWVFIGLAILTASADAVVALGNSNHDSLATGEVWTLIAGRAPHFGDAAATGLWATLADTAAWVMDLPAWVVIGPLGALLVAAFRRRQHRHRPLFRHHRTFG
ncbi:hypothetical protein ACM64Y_15160 [Novispirillum sp. DQ9]|uniref:hypothetical protein n=1 Tax=Novispirillum sp. DQ9 TaxID=3398612 RepID=UPI003C7EB726